MLDIGNCWSKDENVAHPEFVLHCRPIQFSKSPGGGQREPPGVK